MSYILDALRKSDAQRRRGEPPALVTPQAAAIAPGRPRALPYRGFLAAALVGAGIVIGAWRPWHAELPARGTETAEVKPLATAQPLPPSPQSVPEPATVAVLKPQAPAPAQIEPRTQAREPSRKVIAALPKKSATPAGDRPEGARGGKPAQEANVVAFSELPVPLQQEIPALSISAHAYSPVPRERLIGINDQVLREGAQVTPNLLLEEITPDGMIMSYKGYRFRRGVR